MRVVVLGGGYAGLAVTQHLESTLPDEVDLLLVDDTGDHLVQHELHRAIRDPAFADAISIPLGELVDRARVVVDTVADVDPGARTVELAESGTLAYDVAAVCLGAETAYHGLESVRERATPLKRLAHAETVRREFLEVVDAGGGTAVVGGAGLSGVQVAGELAALAREEDAADAVRVVLLEQAPDVAPGFPEPFRRAVRDLLDQQGVDVRTGATVAHASADAVEFEERDPLTYDAFVWTGGIAGTAAMDGRRPQVRATLALDERTFVAGDAARVVDADGEAVPASAQTAVREAPVVARNVAEAVAAEREGYRPRFEQWRFDSPGWLVSVGDEAVAQLGPEVVTGAAAELIKGSVGVTYLADHGSLRDALAVLREDVDGAAAVFDHLSSG